MCFVVLNKVTTNPAYFGSLFVAGTIAGQISMFDQAT